MAVTRKGTYYPGNYSEIADIPEDMKKMAESIDEQTDKLVSKQEGKELIETELINKLKGLNNYNDTAVKKDIADIKQEQTEQNTNIAKNTADIANLDLNKASKTELQEATLALQAELLKAQEEIERQNKDYEAGTLEGEAEGESLYLQDSSDARFRSFEIGGNSKQETEPTLENPSKIEAVGQDVNIFDSSIFEDIEQNGVKIERNADGTLTLNGTYTGTTNWPYRFNLPTPIVTNTKEQLYLSMQKIKGDCTGQIRFTVWEANGDNRWLSLEANQYADLLKEKTYNRASIIIYAGAIFDNLTIGLKISKQKDSEYSSYNCKEINVKICNNNINDNVYELGTINTSEGYKQASTTTLRGNYIKIKPNTNYYVALNKISGLTVTSYSFRYFDKNKKYLGSIAFGDITTTPKTLKIEDENVAYIRMLVLNNAEINNAYDLEIQIEEEKATGYAEHEEQTITVPIQQEMYDKDYFGTDGEHHIMREIIVDGQTIKATQTKNTGTTIQCLIGTSNLIKENAEGFCNMGIQASTYNKVNTFVVSSTKNVYMHFALDILGEQEITDANLNALLKQKYDEGTPLTFILEAKEETVLPFTEAQKTVAKQIRETLHTYKNGTHVYCTDEVSTIINARYTLNQKAYIQAEINKMQAMILAGEE